MKSADAFRTISEVSELLDTPAHVLRFWESRFTQIKPIKRAGGRRYYRPGDVALLGGIKQLLHDDGLTIRGVQKILRERGVAHVSGLSPHKIMDAVGLAATAAPDLHPLPDDVLVEEVLVENHLMEREAEGDEADFDPEAEAWLEAAFDEAPTEVEPAPADELPLWAASDTPDTAEADTRLLPDPDDIALADEAPMQIDVPTLPDLGHGMVTAIGRVRGLNIDPPFVSTEVTDTAPSATVEDPAPDDAPAVMEAAADASLIDVDLLPAARLLRAMTALRARDHRDELVAIYDRALRLHERLSQTAEQPPEAV